MEKQYLIIGNVTLKTRDGWDTGRQVPQFYVLAESVGHAARIARSVILSAADSESDAKAVFGLVDVDDDENYGTEKDANR